MVLVLVLVGEQYCSRAVPSVPSGRTTHCSNTADEPAHRKWIRTFHRHVSRRFDAVETAEGPSRPQPITCARPAELLHQQVHLNRSVPLLVLGTLPLAAHLLRLLLGTLPLAGHLSPPLACASISQQIDTQRLSSGRLQESGHVPSVSL